ncbi:MAG: ABC transporter permease [Eubacteriaceae bacterium]|nr:ABC transporter permease [Eubacteriaceae bacterium]
MKVRIQTIIILVFIALLFVIGSFVGVNPAMSANDVVMRFVMNGILVLSMVPMVESGCGLNFGVPVGIIAGILGALISLEMELGGIGGLFAAIAMGIGFAVVLGLGYGLLLNKVKGDEMLIATYVGYSLVYLMNVFWIVLPFRNPSSVQGYGGSGLRSTISIDKYWQNALNNVFSISIGKYITIPVGTLVFFGLLCFAVWAFFKTKLGTAMSAVGANPDFARAGGINVDMIRVISVVMSTVLAAIGIIIYQQCFGFIQTFSAPLAFSFSSVSALLLGGASLNKASIKNVILGTFLFQAVLTMTPTVINSAIEIDASEVIRIIVTNGMIVFALTRKTKEAK